jgi:small conductance mechanosensitive channel
MEDDEQARNDSKLGDSSGSTGTTKYKALKKVIILGVALFLIFVITTFILRPIIPSWVLLYVQLAEIAILAYFFIEIVSNAVYRVAANFLGETAHSIKIFIRITGAIVVAAIIISYLGRDPIYAAVITTVTGLVVGFASKSLIENLIAGLYLAIIRPFKVGDRISVFGNTGIIYEISLFYSRLLSDTGDIVIAANSSLVSATVVIHKKEDS